MQKISTNNLIQSPDRNKKAMNSATTSMPGPESFDDFIFIFLLGVIACKWWINYDKKRIRIYLPESKRYLAQTLKLEWGGTVSTVTGTEHHGVMWQTTSTKSFKQIMGVARRVKPWLPPEFFKQLNGFMQTYV